MTPLPPGHQNQGALRWLILVITTLHLMSSANTAQAQTSPFGNYHALVIGNNAYQHWAPLHTAVNDAEAVASILERKYGFEVTLLKDATRTEMLDKINALRANLTEDDNLLIYYAGHGVLDGLEGFWIGVDSRKKFEAGWLAASTITRNLRHMNAHHVLVVADSCYSGSLTQRRADNDAGLTSGEKRSSFLARMRKKRTRLALVSGSLEKVADIGRNANHSPFAIEFIDALKEQDPDEILEGQRLFAQIREGVIFNTKQTPDYGRLIRDDGGDFLFVPRGLSTNSVETHTIELGPQRDLQRGDVFHDCGVCPEMVVVAAGSFAMGSLDGEEGRYDDEGPQHRVEIPEPIAVSKYEITFEEWDACTTAGACEGYRPGDAGWGRGRRPVINVSWDDAQAYVGWLSQESGQPYRLLSEAEWEYAARAGTTTRFSWGDSDPTPDQANFARNVGRTTEVGFYSPNPWGLHDMHGNVREWVEDCRNGSYEGAANDRAAWTSGDCNSRGLRGGSWGSRPRSLRSAFRYWLNTDSRDSYFGFRVARTLLRSERVTRGTP